METRIFTPRQDLIHTLRAECLPWIGKEVTIESWHPITAERTKKLFPDDVKVGFVREFFMDVPESELEF